MKFHELLLQVANGCVEAQGYAYEQQACVMVVLMMMMMMMMMMILMMMILIMMIIRIIILMMMMTHEQAQTVTDKYCRQIAQWKVEVKTIEVEGGQNSTVSEGEESEAHRHAHAGGPVKD